MGNKSSYYRDSLVDIGFGMAYQGTCEKIKRVVYCDSFENTVVHTRSPTYSSTFTGREYDPESGLYYYRARYYDPGIGRFLSEDPIGFLGGINFYNYTHNNPINFNDPLGFKTWIFISTGGTGGAAMVGGQAGIYHLIDPATGRYHSWYFFGGGPSLGFWGAGYVIGGFFEAPDDPSNMTSISLAFSLFAASGKGAAGEVTGTSFWGEGEGGGAAGFAAGAGAGGYIIYSFWHETGCIIPPDLLSFYEGIIERK